MKTSFFDRRAEIEFLPATNWTGFEASPISEEILISATLIPDVFAAFDQGRNLEAFR
jgi:hypothetical protein